MSEFCLRFIQITAFSCNIYISVENPGQFIFQSFFTFKLVVFRYQIIKSIQDPAQLFLKVSISLSFCFSILNMKKLQILVQGHVGLNRAVDGDIVAVELLPEDEWSVPSDMVLQDEGEEDPGDVLDDENDLIVQKPAKKVDCTPTGRIVGIIRRKWRQYCGILQSNPVKGVSFKNKHYQGFAIYKQTKFTRNKNKKSNFETQYRD